MSARSSDESPIRYLSIDEMMLKIVEMRAARQDVAAIEPQPIPKPPVSEPRELEFPEYVSHCEAWAGYDRRHTEPRITRLNSHPRQGLAASRPAARPPRKIRPARRNTVQAGMERYAFSIATAGIAVLLLIGGALNLGSGQPRMLMTASSQQTLAAGSEPWVEIPDDGVVYPDSATPEQSRPALPRVSPERLEKVVHQMLASNGFPDVGVSASHSGEIYLAGDVYSLEEAGHVVKVARRAARGSRVYFLHPDVRSAQGMAYFGALTVYAPQVWGAQVTRVVIGSPAYKAGIRAGDVIREFDGRTVNDGNDLASAVAEHKPGQRVAVRIWRDGGSTYHIARLTGLRQFALR